VGPDRADPGEGDVTPVGLDTNGFGGEGDPTPVATRLCELREPDPSIWRHQSAIVLQVFAHNHTSALGMVSGATIVVGTLVSKLPSQR